MSYSGCLHFGIHTDGKKVVVQRLKQDARGRFRESRDGCRASFDTCQVLGDFILTRIADWLTAGGRPDNEDALLLIRSLQQPEPWSELGFGTSYCHAFCRAGELTVVPHQHRQDSGCDCYRPINSMSLAVHWELGPLSVGQAITEGCSLSLQADAGPATARGGTLPSGH